MATESIPSLFGELCQLQIEHRTPSLVQPKLSRDRQKRHLKAKAFSALFGHLFRKTNDQQDRVSGSPLTRVDQLLAIAFQLRCEHRFDDANLLENCINSLKCSLTEDMLCAMCTLLLKLRNTGSSDSDACLSKSCVPFVHPAKNSPNVLPAKSFHCYSDTRFYTQQYGWFQYFPREIFTAEMAPVCEAKFSSAPAKLPDPFQIFYLTPGSALNAEGIFKPMGSDDYALARCSSLFGALVESRVTSVDDKLSFPAMPDEVAPSIFHPKQISPDEGYPDSLSKNSSDSSSDADGGYGSQENIWELAVSDRKISENYTWENVGGMPCVRERCYLSESPSSVFESLLHLHHQQLRLLHPSLPEPDPRPTSHPSMITDLVHLMLGAPSESFLFDITTESFILRPGRRVSGLSPDAFLAFCQPFLAAGTQYWHLSKFSQPSVMDSNYSAGLVLQAFRGAIRKYLQHYRACVLSLHPDSTLLGLASQLQDLISQLCFVARLCRCSSDTKTDESDFPTGIQLLSYLYETALDAVCLPHYPMMLSLLKESCGPYLRFVEDWVFHGISRDIYGEFMIQTNEKYLKYRDKMYWSNGFVMGDGHSVPVFLSDLANDIFVCGKSINLLRLCQPQHFLFTSGLEAPPRVGVSFTEEELVAMETECLAYASRMEVVGQQMARAADERRRLAEEARQELIAQVRRSAAREAERLQAESDERRRQQSLKKKQLLEELRQQMEKDLKRRVSAKEQEAAEDAERAEAWNRQELLEGRVEAELERQAREELIAHYERLSAEAALRERRALWRVRRRQLDSARQQLMEADAEKWAQEMANLGLDPPTHPAPIEVDEAPAFTVREDQDLPKWAKRGLRRQRGPYESLPKWAQEGLEREDVVKVEASEEEIQVQRILHHKGAKVDKPLRLPDQPTPQKTQVRLVSGSHVSEQTQSTSVEKPSIKIQPAEQRSEVKEVKPHVKAVENRGATVESSEEREFRPHVRVGDQAAALKESKEVERKPRKTVGDQHVTQETESSEQKPHLKTVAGEHASKETEAAPAKAYKPSIYGHVSELTSMEYDLLLPKVKKFSERHANTETSTMDADYFGYQIKPNRRKRVANLQVNDESVPVVTKPKSIQMVADMYASKESDHVDVDQIRLQKFRERNVQGHASKSTVEKLLYGTEFGQFNVPSEADSSDGDSRDSAADIVLWTDVEREPYQSSFDFLGGSPIVDLLQGPFAQGAMKGRHPKMPEEEQAHSYISLQSALSRSVTTPLRTQIHLVNQCLVGYFRSELRVDLHFEALRCFLFMHDGEFSHSLSLHLFNKLGMNPRPGEIFNPVFLNSCLNKAIATSLHASSSERADQLSFSLRYLPQVLKPNAQDALDSLYLVYKVDWPLNIVITDGCMAKYNEVFSFMLRLKRAVWTLEDVCSRLKRDALIHRANRGSQFTQLHLFRHEMQHFVKVIQGYISNQIIHVTWQEFQQQLQSSVSNLDDLHAQHVIYLNRALSRCLLNKKAAPVMKIIHDIFNLILKFHSQLISQSWAVDSDSGQVAHPAFEHLRNSYKAFNECSVFLYKVVNKLAIRRYQPHLHELLLMLNFNSFYTRRYDSLH